MECKVAFASRRKECTYGSIGAEGLDVDVVKGYILGAYKECCPEEDGSVVGV